MQRRLLCRKPENTAKTFTRSLPIKLIRMTLSVSVDLFTNKCLEIVQTYAGASVPQQVLGH